MNKMDFVFESDNGVNLIPMPNSDELVHLFNQDYLFNNQKDFIPINQSHIENQPKDTFLHTHVNHHYTNANNEVKLQEPEPDSVTLNEKTHSEYIIPVNGVQFCNDQIMPRHKIEWGSEKATYEVNLFKRITPNQSVHAMKIGEGLHNQNSTAKNIQWKVPIKKIIASAFETNLSDIRGWVFFAKITIKIGSQKKQSNVEFKTSDFVIETKKKNNLSDENNMSPVYSPFVPQRETQMIKKKSVIDNNPGFIKKTKTELTSPIICTIYENLDKLAQENTRLENENFSYAQTVSHQNMEIEDLKRRLFEKECESAHQKETLSKIYSSVQNFQEFFFEKK